MLPACCRSKNSCDHDQTSKKLKNLTCGHSLLISNFLMMYHECKIDNTLSLGTLAFCRFLGWRRQVWSSFSCSWKIYICTYICLGIIATRFPLFWVVCLHFYHWHVLLVEFCTAPCFLCVSFTRLELASSHPLSCIAIFWFLSLSLQILPFSRHWSSQSEIYTGNGKS